MFDFFYTLWNEFRSYFVPQKVEYEISGECKKCGKCCNYMYSVDTYTEKEFKIMQFLFPPYKRFYIKGRDEDNTSPSIRCRHRSQRLEELVKNGNCSYPVGEEDDGAR